MRRFKHYVRRHIHSHHRRYSNPYLTAFRRYPRPPVFDLAPVGVTVQVDVTLLGPHGPRKRRAHTVKVDRKLARLHIKRHKVAVDIHTRNLQLTKSCGLCTSPPRRKLALTIPAAFSPRVKMGFIIAEVELRILTLPPRLRRPCGSVTCTAIELAVIGQADGPAQFSTIVM